LKETEEIIKEIIAYQLLAKDSVISAGDFESLCFRISRAEIVKSHIFYEATVCCEKMVNFSQMFKYIFIYIIV